MILHTHCCYCRRKFSETDRSLMRTRDHFIPSSRSGTGEENILQCCLECNQWKADKMPEFWLDRVIYFKNKRKKFGNYSNLDYCQIIGSIKHWVKHFKDKIISEYKR